MNRIVAAGVIAIILMCNQSNTMEFITKALSTLSIRKKAPNPGSEKFKYYKKLFPQAKKIICNLSILQKISPLTSDPMMLITTLLVTDPHEATLHSSIRFNLLCYLLYFKFPEEPLMPFLKKYYRGDYSREHLAYFIEKRIVPLHTHTIVSQILFSKSHLNPIQKKIVAIIEHKSPIESIKKVCDLPCYKNILWNYALLFSACCVGFKSKRANTNREELIKYITPYADINAQDHYILENGKTALIYCAHDQQNASLVKWLLEHGADVNIRTNSHKTIFDYALKPEVAVVLIDHYTANS